MYVRLIVKKIQLNKDFNCNKRTRAVIYTMADTAYAGSTFKLVESNEKVVDVDGFHSNLGKMKDFYIITAITAINVKDETIIDSFPQSLYLGILMENSLIAPSQLWDYERGYFGVYIF